MAFFIHSFMQYFCRYFYVEKYRFTTFSVSNYFLFMVNKCYMFEFIFAFSLKFKFYAMYAGVIKV